MANLDSLPSEIFFQIAQFLEPLELVSLQHVNKRLLLLNRDDNLWRTQCFQTSTFLTNLRRRASLLSSGPPTLSTTPPQFRDLALALAAGNGLDGDSRLTAPRAESRTLKAQSQERIRIMANWDPSYPDEKVKWYDEYIARNAPISTSWMQQPRNRESKEKEWLEVRGMGIYTPPGEEEGLFVVGLVDDGSVCLWDLSGIGGRKGRIVSRSREGLVGVDASGSGNEGWSPRKRSKMISTGVTECVSVDSARKRAYFAVQSGLVEVDLETLQTVNHERFPFSITALSEAKHPVPLTVGTNLCLYLHDSRTRRSSGTIAEHDLPARLDALPSPPCSPPQSFRNLLNPAPNPSYAHLHHPGPLSILHLPNGSGETWDGNGDIYVCGRFPSILNYDRRSFPKLRGTIHSGARLCSLTSLPYPFASLEKDLARRGELSTSQVLAAKTRPGKTLIAVGEYNSKGSLEMYGLSPNPELTTISSDSSAGTLRHSVLKNRQTSSSSKLLSVANHGTRLVVSDGGGNLKWLERDGFTEARRWNIAHGTIEAPRGIFGSLGDSYMDSGSGDIVIKMVSTNKGHDTPVTENDLVMWTGEKLGLLGFGNKPGFTAESFEDRGTKTPEELRMEDKERVHSETMRRALEASADEVRWMRGLGGFP